MNQNIHGQQPVSVTGGRTVAELISTRYAKVPPWFAVDSALRVARLKQVDHLVVAEGGRVVGAVSVARLEKAPPGEPLSSWLSATLALAPTLAQAEALELLTRAEADCAPVAMGALMMGIVTRIDLERTQWVPALDARPVAMAVS